MLQSLSAEGDARLEAKSYHRNSISQLMEGQTATRRFLYTQSWEMRTPNRNPMQREQGARLTGMKVLGDPIYHVCTAMRWLEEKGHEASLGHVLHHTSALSY